jgi:hypothetical protein
LFASKTLNSAWEMRKKNIRNSRTCMLHVENYIYSIIMYDQV